MRLLLQRVKQAAVHVDEEKVGAINAGLLVFVGFGQEDDADLPDSKIWKTMLKKMFELRIFPDASGKLNRCVTEHAATGAQMLLVSQFTLYADCRKGRRPSFTKAAPPDVAHILYDRFVQDAAAMWPGKVQSGRFAADMDVSLTNWGPVTIWLSSDSLQG